MPRNRKPKASPHPPRASSPSLYGRPMPSAQPSQPVPIPAPGGNNYFHPSYQTATGPVSGIQRLPAEAAGVTPIGAQPVNVERISPSGYGVEVYSAPPLRGIAGSPPETAIQSRPRDFSPNPVQVAGAGAGTYGSRLYSPSPNPAVVPPSGNLPRVPSPDLGAALVRGRHPRSRDASPRPPVGRSGPRSQTPSPIPNDAPYGNQPRNASPRPPVGRSGPRSQTPSPIPNATPYGNQPRDLPPIPGTAASARYRSRSLSPLPGAAMFGPSPGFPSPVPAPHGNRSRDPSPNPGQAPALSRYHDLRAASEAGTVRPRAEQLQTLPPDAFSRPAKLSQSNTFFETRKIQDMDDFDMPRMPKALLLRDVRYEDWIHFIQDLTLAWAGKLPTSDSNGSSRRSVATAGLIDHWNESFFARRGVEVLLFKGHERRSGQLSGQIERDLPGFSDDSDSDSSDSLSSDSSAPSDNYYGRGHGGSAYNGSFSDARRRKANRKTERKRKEEARRRARKREKTYALYIGCATPRDGALGPLIG